MNKKKQTIGILGGMGPAASVYMYGMIVRLAQGQYQAMQDTDYPPMIIYNLPLEGFDETGIVDASFVKRQLIAGVHKLESAGSDFIIIACNTVHQFYDEMQSAVSVPIINMIDIVAHDVKSAGYTSVGLLCSQTTREMGLYQRALRNNNLVVHIVSDAQQHVVNEVISHVMAGTQGEADVRELNAFIQEFKERGAQAVILGCTELPLAISQTDSYLPLFNSVEAIAYSALERALKVV